MYDNRVGFHFRTLPSSQEYLTLQSGPNHRNRRHIPPSPPLRLSRHQVRPRLGVLRPPLQLVGMPAEEYRPRLVSHWAPLFQAQKKRGEPLRKPLHPETTLSLQLPPFRDENEERNGW